MRLICVLGMHRTGTSAVAGLLHELGGHAGNTEELLDAQPENPRGFFENRQLVAINKGLLRKLGGSWSTPPTLPQGWELSGHLASERREAAELMEQLAREADDWVLLKDPRLTLLLPFWRTVHPVTANISCVRHPFDTASSLAKRNGFAIEKGAYLWMRYTAAALTAEPAPLLVFYERLVDDPPGEAARIAGHLGVAGEQVEAAALSAVDAGLRHQRHGSKIPAAIGEAAMVVYEQLLAGAGRLDEMSSEARRLVELHLGHWWKSADFGDVVPVDRQAREDVERVSKELEKATARQEEWSRRAENAGSRADQMQGRVKALRSQLQDLRAERTDLRTRFVEQSDQLLEAQRLISRQSVEADQLRRSLAQTEQGLSQRQAQIDRLMEREQALRRGLERSESDRRKSVALYRRLRNRRLVRISLRLAGLSRPLFRLIRRLRGRSSARHVQRALDTGGGSKSEPIRKRSSDFDRALDARTRQVLRSHYRAHQRRYDNVLVSVVMPTYNRAGMVEAAIKSVRAQSHRNWELIIVDDGSTDATPARLRRYSGDERVRVIRLDNSGVSAARNAGLEKASGEFVFYLDSDNEWDADFLRNMIVAMEATNADCGYSVVEVVDDADATNYFRGDRFDWEACRQGNYIDLNVFAHRRMPMAAQTGFDSKLRRMVDWDFILRVTKDARVVFVPFVGCRYRDSASDPVRISNREPLVWDQVLRARHSSSDGLVPWEKVVGGLRLSFALKIPAPESRKAEWGDYHFASSLAKALKRLGHSARIDFLGQWSGGEPSDVSLVLRGLTAFEPTPGAINVMWNISHPDQASYWEYRECQLVYVASESYAAFLAHALGNGVTVKYLPQATDAVRFSPARRKERSPHSADLLFVGNTRDEFRDIVRWAVEGGLPVSVYGRGWSQFLGPEHIAGELIDNEALGAAYATSGIVLNDHWASMRDFGIVSNRIFDVCATGTRVISDPHPALSRLFGETVSQVESAPALAAAIAEQPSHDPEELSRWVLDHHTFDQRARSMVADLVTWLGLPAPPSPPQPTATRSRRRERLRVGIATTDGRFGPQSSAFIRLISPLTTEWAIERLELRRVKPETIPSDLDVVIVQRTSVADLSQAERVVESLTDSNIALVVDLDDAFHLIDERHPEYDRYRHKIGALEYLLCHASQRWFSTEFLMRSYDHLSLDNQLVMPNTLDPRLWRRYLRRGDQPPPLNAKPKLLYMGTATHDADYAMVHPVLKQLSAELDFELFLVGALRSDVPEEPWLTRCQVPLGTSVYPRFVQWLRSLGPFDVGLSPLEDSPFNRCKSDIKFLDYSALGLLSVVSDLTPYQDEVKRRGLTVMCQDGEWTDRLYETLTQIEAFSEMRTEATEYLWSARSTEDSSRRMVEQLQVVASLADR